MNQPEDHALGEFEQELLETGLQELGRYADFTDEISSAVQKAVLRGQMAHISPPQTLSFVTDDPFLLFQHVETVFRQ